MAAFRALLKERQATISHPARKARVGKHLRKIGAG
jgi:hypothetical protein